MDELKKIDDIEKKTVKALDYLYYLQDGHHKDNRRFTMFIGIALLIGLIFIALTFHFIDIRITRLERKIREQEQTIYYLQEGGDNVMEHIEYIECEITPEYCQRYDAYN